jgi:ABC-type siderophore export system fused ATPase/permease subunit
MPKAQNRITLQTRLTEVNQSIAALESTHPNHPALYHLRSERKWMEQKIKQTFWYKFTWKIRNLQGVFMMATVGIRLWFLSRILYNKTNRVLFFMVLILFVSVVVLWQGRRLYGWDLFPNSDNPIDEWILGN